MCQRQDLLGLQNLFQEGLGLPTEGKGRGRALLSSTDEDQRVTPAEASQPLQWAQVPPQSHPLTRAPRAPVLPGNIWDLGVLGGLGRGGGGVGAGIFLVILSESCSFGVLSIKWGFKNSVVPASTALP